MPLATMLWLGLLVVLGVLFVVTLAPDVARSSPGPGTSSGSSAASDSLDRRFAGVDPPAGPHAWTRRAATPATRPPSGEQVAEAQTVLDELLGRGRARSPPRRRWRRRRSC